MIEIPVRLASRAYRIMVAAGARADVGVQLAKLSVGRRVALLTDATIRHLHGEVVTQSLVSAGFDVTEVLLPEGEQAKTLDVLREVWDDLLEAGCDRTSTVVALGGGAVGDLAGFAAATYMRGINFVQVPTTLLAQVDASIGGKTAIDHPRAKNLIGAFHQPRLVMVDPAALTTLSEREYRSGLAEVIKHGIVLDAAYFEDLERSLPALLVRDLVVLERVVAGSCRLKAAVVERDEQEAELRHVLNYGHTIGHALEAATGFDPLHPRRGRLARHGRRGAHRRAPRHRQPRRRRRGRSRCWAPRDCPCGASGPRPRPSSTRWGATRSRVTGAFRSSSLPRSAPSESSSTSRATPFARPSIRSWPPDQRVAPPRRVGPASG